MFDNLGQFVLNYFVSGQGLGFFQIGYVFGARFWSHVFAQKTSGSSHRIVFEPKSRAGALTFGQKDTDDKR